MADKCRAAVASVAPVHKDSRFVSEGKLLPSEFLEAGEQLVFKFPSWEWAPAKEGFGKDDLPSDKQYLITKNVPCRDRVKALNDALISTKEEDGWVVPVDDGITSDSAAAAGASAFAVVAGGEGAGQIEVEEDFLANLGDGDNEFADLDKEVEEQDAARAGVYLVAETPDDAHLKMRTYNLSVTYDRYYQVARMWLFGYDANGTPLKSEQVFEDVLSEYKEKTVTIEPHPHTGEPTVSIHPCRHAQVMKGVVDSWVANNQEPKVDQSLLVFLKFISGVVPTINYDFTSDVEWY